MTDYIKKIERKGFNWWVDMQTKKAQKKYGFDMTKKEYSVSNTHNNEADAFKHAYMSWLLVWHVGDKKAKELGDMHEDETPKAPAYERNMDLWNNEIGREIAYEMKNNLGDSANILGTEWASDIASQKIWEKMQQGELITNPMTDKRKFENMELERLTENDRIYSDGEFRNFDEKVKALRYDKYMDYVINNKWEIPSVENLDKRVQRGELIYVDNYTRSDGTKVNGYYRRKPYYASKK